jgi:uncharacterized protein YceK
MAKALLILAMLAALAGCASTRTGSLCTAGPIRPDAGAETRWTQSEQDQVTLLNESGEIICGWRP